MASGRPLLSARSAADAGWLYGAHVARYLAPLLLYPVLTRRLGLDGFGVYAASLALALIVAVVVDYGLSLAGPRDIAADIEGRGVVVGQALALRALLIAPAVAVGFGLAMATPALQGDMVATAMAVILGVGQGAGLLWYFQGVRDPAPAALLEVGFALAAAVAVLAVPTLSTGGVIAVQAAGVWGGLAATAGLLIARQAVTPPTIQGIRRALIDGAPLFASRAVIVAYTGAAVLMTAALAGPVQAALYGVADRLVSAAGSLMRPMAGMVAPRIAGLLTQDRAGAFRTARWTLIGAFGLFLALAVVLAIAAPVLVRLLFGPAFAGATDVLRLLALVLPLVAISQVLGVHLMTALRMDRRFAAMTALGCFATLGVGWLLTPTGGAVGMAGARIAGEVAVILAGLVCLKGHWGALFQGEGSRHVPAL